MTEGHMMFRSVQLVGFDKAPKWRKLVESAVPVLADELRKSANHIRLLFNLRAAEPGTPVLEVELTDEVFGQKADIWNETDLSDERELRHRGRSLHVEVLTEYLDRRVEEWKKEWSEPVEA